MSIGEDIYEDKKKKKHVREMMVKLANFTEYF